jgi:hypothetical protein
MPMHRLMRAGRNKSEIDAHTIAALLLEHRPEHVFLERAGAMPGQGTSSMFAFGRAYGIVIGVLAATGMPTTFVAASVWKRALAVPAAKRRRESPGLTTAADCGRPVVAGQGSRHRRGGPARPVRMATTQCDCRWGGGIGPRRHRRLYRIMNAASGASWCFQISSSCCQAPRRANVAARRGRLDATHLEQLHKTGTDGVYTKMLRATYAPDFENWPDELKEVQWYEVIVRPGYRQGDVELKMRLGVETTPKRNR